MKRKRLYGPQRTGSKSSKKYAKKRSANIIRPVLSKSMLQRPLGNAMGVKLQYHYEGSLNPPAAGALQVKTFRLQSLHDTDTGVGNSRPIGVDQLEQLFEDYKVWKVDYLLQIVSLDSTNPQRVGYRIIDSQDLPTSVPQMYEQGVCEAHLLGARGSSGSYKSFRGSINLPQFHGRSYTEYMGDDTYGAKFGANPTEEAFFNICADGLGVDTAGVYYIVQLVFHSKLSGACLIPN